MDVCRTITDHAGSSSSSLRDGINMSLGLETSRRFPQRRCEHVCRITTDQGHHLEGSLRDGVNMSVRLPLTRVIIQDQKIPQGRYECVYRITAD